MQPGSLTLPSLATTISIDEATIKGFRDNGHALVRGILSHHEVASYREVIRVAAKQLSGSLPNNSIPRNENWKSVIPMEKRFCKS